MYLCLKTALTQHQAINLEALLHNLPSRHSMFNQQIQKAALLIKAGRLPTLALH